MKIINLIDVEDEPLVAATTTTPITSKTIQYYRQQLSMYAVSIKEVKLIDRATDFKYTDQVKKLVANFKQLISVNNQTIKYLTEEDKKFNAPNQAVVFNRYCESIQDLSNENFKLFLELKNLKENYIQTKKNK